MKTLDAKTFYQQSRERLVLDVRAESEFADGHIPDAKSLPLFDDQQRAEVGTVYAKQGRDAAVVKGLEFVGPKMAGFVTRTKELLEQTGGRSVFVHCWRGGMRSQSFAWLLETAGLNPVVLDGGYKAFRKQVEGAIGRRHAMVVLSGLTGAGKTLFLESLRQRGEQVVDLEALANHRGSAFGSIGLGEQPTTQQFENDLFVELFGLEAGRRFWVEDEGSRIGRVVVPTRFVKQIRKSPAVFLDVPPERRLDNLMDEYGDLEPEELAQAMRNIGKRLGGQNVKEAIDAIEAGDMRRAAEISLAYYDRSYQKAADKLPRETTVSFSTAGLSDQETVETIIAKADLLDVPRLALASNASE